MPEIAARTARWPALGLIGLAFCVSHARAEDGYDLWLRYRPVEAPWAARYAAIARELVPPAGTTAESTAHASTTATIASAAPTIAAASSLAAASPAAAASPVDASSPAVASFPAAASSPAASSPAAAENELKRGIVGLLGAAPPVSSTVTQDGALVWGTPSTSSIIAGLSLNLEGLGADGYRLRTVRLGGHRVTVIAANAEPGVIHGVFRLLRMIETRQSVDALDIRDAPRIERRVLDHWDNLDGTVERGYAGASIWDWQKLPDYRAPRYVDYARACASIGLNGSLLANVNSDATVLTAPYIDKAAALARVFRPYGIRVYLPARFTAPRDLGGLPTADPLDPAVREWWRRKADEIYAAIPDFGGFVVKAGSEGQPGPQDFQRTHADGANLLAAALSPHGGVVMWRAFVYASRPGEDRTRQAFDEFAPLDGRFADNVLLQVKNGPLDFQPREPPHPLFGAMPRTSLALEVQITKEYLGFATHLVYLGPLFEETLRFDTFAAGRGSTVARIVDGTLEGHGHTGMAGVANVGADRNWSGSHFDQANWYAFGRLAWDPMLSSRDLAEEWMRMTFSNDAGFVEPVVAMMMGSRQAAVDYMTPLGLAHLMAAGAHYGPGPWQHGDAGEWPTGFHRADARGIGADRSRRGSGAVTQYAPAVAAVFDDPARTPERYLLWFHHLPWDHRMHSGHTLWEELALRYTAGAAYVRSMRETWATLAAYVDAERFADVAAFLAIQEKEAAWWRDASLAYFQSLSGRPLPAGVPAPERPLAAYEAMSFPYAPGNPGWTAAPLLH